MLTLIVVAVSAMLVLCLSVLLAAHKDYHSGFFGTLGLSLIALAAFARASSIFTEWSSVEVSNIGVIFWLGMACFLGQTGIRFLLRQKQHDKTWYDVTSPKRMKDKTIA
jgi:hypothetical protein